MKRRYKFDDMRRSRICDELQAREMRHARNRKDTELRSEKLVLNLALWGLRNCDIVAMVQPHACGRGFGDVCVVEVVRELEAVAPATDDQGHSEHGENAGLEEVKRG